MITSETVESLHRYLDAHPTDHSARLALADAVTEAGGDGRGWEALARLERLPTLSASGEWWWGSVEWLTIAKYVTAEERLPADWFDLLRPGRLPTVNFLSRILAETAAATAFLKLPPERQQQLLSAEVEDIFGQAKHPHTQHTS